MSLHLPRRIRFSTFFALVALLPALLWAQPKSRPRPLLQLTGMIKAEEGNSPIPFATVRIKNTFRGTIAGLDGFYSMVVAEGDTVEYIAYGFKTIQYITPVNDADHQANYNVLLPTDTFTYRPIDSFPYASREEFRQAFMSLKVDENMQEIARRNLDPAKMAELYETLARDGNEMQMYTLQQIALSYYYSGGQRNYMMLGNGSGFAVPTSLLDPFAWTKFIQSIRQGKYKKKPAPPSQNKY